MSEITTKSENKCPYFLKTKSWKNKINRRSIFDLNSLFRIFFFIFHQQLIVSLIYGIYNSVGNKQNQYKKYLQYAKYVVMY